MSVKRSAATSTNIHVPSQEKLLANILQKLYKLNTEQQALATGSTIKDLMVLQRQISKILTSRDQIYFAISHWGGLITTNDGMEPDLLPLDEYQGLIEKMVNVLWDMSPLLQITRLRLLGFIAEWGARWPKGPRDSPGVFTFFQNWQAEDEIPDVHNTELMLDYWLQERGDISPSCTEVIRSFEKYEAALRDMMKPPPRARLGEYAGTYVIWRQHMLGAYCTYLWEHRARGQVSDIVSKDHANV